MSPRDLRPLVFVAAVAVIFAATHSVVGLDVGWLMMAPALLLLVPLLSGRFVGEETLRRWSASRRAAPRRLRGERASRPRMTRSGMVRGPLLARRMAGRAPPAVALAA
jgi:hypothetical protein